jgi:hypothetical protein
MMFGPVIALMMRSTSIGAHGPWSCSLAVAGALSGQPGTSDPTHVAVTPASSR